MRYLIALALAITIAATVTPAYAAPAEQTCLPDAFNQSDLAGIYVSSANQMRITIHPCGGTTVLWVNQYGTHEAGYLSNQRMAAGGVIAKIMVFDPVVGSLDNRTPLGLKPAEPGWIQAITVSPFGDDIKVYRLRKL